MRADVEDSALRQAADALTAGGAEVFDKPAICSPGRSTRDATSTRPRPTHRSDCPMRNHPRRPVLLIASTVAAAGVGISLQAIERTLASAGARSPQATLAQTVTAGPHSNRGGMRYAYLVGSLGFLLIWLVVWLGVRTGSPGRLQMLRVSAVTGLFGLTEPFFVPDYWNPPTLFDLAGKTGFDIEAILFSFAVGGIATAIYGVLRTTRQIPMTATERHRPRHRLHYLALAVPAPVFLVLAAATRLNPIYTTIAALLAGAVATGLCRPDLLTKMIVSGVVFLGLYFAFFLIFTAVYPVYIDQVWNLRALSGVLIAGVPLEELLFGFSFGLMWSAVFEHVTSVTVQTRS